MLLMAVQIVDPHLEEAPIFTLPAMPHPAQILSRILETPTAHQLATVMAAPSLRLSWQEVTIFSLMRLKCFMKLLKTKKLKQQ